MLCMQVDRAVGGPFPGLLRTAFSLPLNSDLCVISSNEFKKLYHNFLSPLSLHFVLPPQSVLIDDLVGEKGDDHDVSYLAPVLAIDGEDHVLTLAGENVKDNVVGAGP